MIFYFILVFHISSVRTNLGKKLWMNPRFAIKIFSKPSGSSFRCHQLAVASEVKLGLQSTPRLISGQSVNTDS